MRNLPVRPFSAAFLGAARAENRNWHVLGWLALYPLAWVMLSSISTSYWILPAGLQLAVLWQLPRRLWPAVGLLEVAAVAVHYLLHGDWPAPLALLAMAALPWLATAGLVALCRPRVPGTVSLGSQLPMLLGCGFMAAIAGGVLVEGAAVLWDLQRDLGGRVFYRVAQSEFVGMLVVAPLVLALAEQVRHRRLGSTAFLASGQVLFPGMALLLSAGLQFEHSVSFSLSLALGALFWLALRQGWRATSVALVGVLLAVSMSDVLMQGWMQPRMSLLMSASAAAALLLGASTDAVRVQGNALHLGLAQLQRRSSELADAAKRLTTVQEHERRTLGTELHDVLGQDITAIATRLRVVERTTSDPQIREGLHSIGILVNEAHLHLREVVEHMYPAVLDRFGLSRALREGPLAQLARESGLDYACEVAPDLPELPQQAATSLYRICQEITSNCARHDGCSVLRISIQLEKSATRAVLVLSTRDDGGRLQISDGRPGLGLQAIRDRANALGALYQFDPLDGRPRHWLSLPLVSDR